METILSINNLSKNYHTKNDEIEAILDFSLDVKKGEFIAIVGPSGCGKSTILSILCNLEKKSGGSISYKHSKEPIIGYMLQQDTLFPWRTILDNCLLGLEVNKSLTEESKKKVLNLLKKYGLSKFINHYPSSLSGGMRQRVALIRTLALNPDILLLDEPFSALDYQARLAVSDDVYRIIKENKKTVIMVTHDLAEAISMADRIVVLSKRPATIKNIYDIKLTNKSTPIENRKAKEFASYYEKIWKDLDIHV
jgi:NitT/TauT family transport system ATP-binding protein